MRQTNIADSCPERWVRVGAGVLFGQQRGRVISHNFVLLASQTHLPSIKSSLARSTAAMALRLMRDGMEPCGTSIAMLSSRSAEFFFPAFRLSIAAKRGDFWGGELEHSRTIDE